MPPSTVDAIVLLGWMDEKEATDFLQKDCFSPEPTSQEDGVRIWREYRDRVEALPVREALAPERQQLSRSERETARRFLAFLYQKGVRDIRDVVKVDLAFLVIHQRLIIMDKVEEYRNKVNTDAGWIRECLPTRIIDASLQVARKREGTKTSAEVRLSHGEFFFDMNPNTGLWSINQGLRHVTVLEFDRRMALHAGYHRSYARMSNTVPDAIERPALVALTSASLRSSHSAAAGNSLLREMRGLRPPLLGDFLDDRLFMRVKLRKKRYELQIRAEVVPFDE